MICIAEKMQKPRMQPGAFAFEGEGARSLILTPATVAEPKLVVGRKLSRLRAAAPPDPYTRSPACANTRAGRNKKLALSQLALGSSPYSCIFR